MEKKKAAALILLAILGFSIAVGLSAYHRAVRPGESFHLFYQFPAKKARPIVFQYGGGGFAKLLDPNTLEVTIALTNRDRKPHMVGFELENLPPNIHVHWSNFYTKGFDEEAKAYLQPVPPKARVSVHLTFFLEDVGGKPVVYSGYFKVYDRATGETLLKIPIKILNVKAGVR
ncbi:hypothetical protein DRO53_04545 [Candidatus Bathyarchaeota archaeon]|nr:MAG: hypothetical protein DRO53_04545 [Candidatus Bathyarchaeota archaeon]